MEELPQEAVMDRLLLGVCAPEFACAPKVYRPELYVHRQILIP